MKQLTVLAFSLLFCCLTAAARTVTLLSGSDWTFDGAPVTVPHTWNAFDAADGENFFELNPGTSVGSPSYARGAHTYARALPAPTPGTRVFLRFEGVSSKCEVRVNGQIAGRHDGAFTAFACEITEFLRPDGNRLAVVADNSYDRRVPPISGDFSLFGGVYRDVWLIETPSVCISPLDDGGSGVAIEADPETGWVTARLTVSGGTNEVRRFRVPDFQLWSPENPVVYTQRFEIASGDAVTERFGFRKVEFRADGFYLNGKRRQLRGVCKHQDRDGKGWAVSAADLAEDVDWLKRMGADSVRTAHYPHASKFYELCDERGILVWTEIPLVDEVAFDETFRSNALVVAREMVVQHRNHPSIVLWGLYNEIFGEGGASLPMDETVALLKEVHAKIKETDASRPTTSAGCDATRSPIYAITDAQGFNLYPGWYNWLPWYEGNGGWDLSNAVRRILKTMPQRRTIAVSEYGGGASVNQHDDPFVKPQIGRFPYPEEYQAYLHAGALHGIQDEPRVWGIFPWLMFDCGADRRQEADRRGINNKGLVTYDRKTAKDAFHLYKANWNPAPELHLVGTRMRTVTNAVVNVMAFSNVGDVTLSVNDRIVGTVTPDRVKTCYWRNVRLAPGVNRISITAGGMTREAEWTLQPGAEGKRDLWISNHTDFPGRKVILDLVGRTNFTYDAKGATLTVGEPAIAIRIRDCKNVTLRNLKIDWERPVLTEGRVVVFTGGKTVVRIDRSRYPVAVEDGRLLMIGPGRRDPIRATRYLDGKTFEPVLLTADDSFGKVWARVLENGDIELDRDYSPTGVGVKVGDILVFRPHARPYPAIFVERSADVILEDVVIRDAYGMGLLAQLSENIRWCGTGKAADKTSGVIARVGSHATTQADASHFSNCRGCVAVENGWFEGMMDDAINVHSTCVQITNVVSQTVIRCRFRHPEAIGFELFRAGDRVRLIRSRTNEDGPVIALADVRRLSDEEVELALAEPLPAGFGPGDTVENADWQCAATFRGNVVKNNRARGVLFTTPHKVICDSNRFERCCGSAVVLASDAYYWFESGHCRDVQIVGNVISNCLSAGKGRHGSAFGVISADPIVFDLKAQKDFCHRHLLVADNKIFTHDAPLLFARSTDDIVWTNNVVRYNDDLPSWKEPPFVLERCDRVRAQPPLGK